MPSRASGWHADSVVDQSPTLGVCPLALSRLSILRSDHALYTRSFNFWALPLAEKARTRDPCTNVTMASLHSHTFASPDSPGATTAVLVLLESSPAMYNYWPELQAYYLPMLLGALHESSGEVPVCTAAMYTVTFRAVLTEVSDADILADDGRRWEREAGPFAAATSHTRFSVRWRGASVDRSAATERRGDEPGLS